MRFIIHEQPYERPLLAGQLRYERDGRPTGAIESWRLNEAIEGYRFLRVDLDASEAPSGRSYLYHLTINRIGRPEQLKYRLWGSDLEVGGSVIWENEHLLAIRKVNGETYEETAAGTAFWFPSGAGLSQLLWSVGETRGITLRTDTDEPSGVMALLETPVAIELGEAETMTVEEEILPVRPLSVSWAGQRRTVWLDTDGRPLRLWRDDGLSASAERLVRYDEH
jgi:hypothetical protein